MGDVDVPTWAIRASSGLSVGARVTYMILLSYEGEPVRTEVLAEQLGHVTTRSVRKWVQELRSIGVEIQTWRTRHFTEYRVVL